MTERTPQEPWGLIDTSVVIAQDVGPLPGSLAISAVTLAELHFGVLVARSAEVRAERLRRLSILQHRFDALPLDEMVAASHGRLAAAVVEAGYQPRRRAMDLLIAATAHAHGAVLWTRNPDYFSGLEDFIEVRAVQTSGWRPPDLAHSSAGLIVPVRRHRDSTQHHCRTDSRVNGTVDAKDPDDGGSARPWRGVHVAT